MGNISSESVSSQPVLPPPPHLTPFDFSSGITNERRKRGREEIDEEEKEDSGRRRRRITRLPELREPVLKQPELHLPEENNTLCYPRNEDVNNQNQINNYIFSELYNPEHIVQSRNGDISFLGATFKYDGLKIGQGQDAFIMKIRDFNARASLAIKFSEYEKEVNIAEELNRRLPSCECLRVKAVGKPLRNPYGGIYTAYFMELADGTLKELLKRIQSVYPNLKSDKDGWRNTLLEIAERIRKQILCIYDMNNEYVYVDLKMDNVLFKCRDPNDLMKVSIMLGDLGSAVPDHTGTYYPTYPPYEYAFPLRRLNGLSNFEKEAVLSWQMGVLLLSIIIDSRVQNQVELFNKLYYQNRESLFLRDLIELKQIMANIYGEDIANYIDSNPENRRSIRLPIPYGSV